MGGTTLAGMVLRRLGALEADERVLATDADGARALSGVAEEFGYSVFAGPKDDVLQRYAMVVEAFSLHRVVRATGDNPFVSVPLARLALQAARERGSDYVGLLGMPAGLGVEVVAARALLSAAALATEPYDREHVCPYLYGRPERFSVWRPECPAEYSLPGSRATVDTPDDYGRALAIVAALGPEPSDRELMSWLRAEAAGTPGS
jgi:spore coat polysaccharide biosynthesis protein SpsF